MPEKQKEQHIARLWELCARAAAEHRLSDVIFYCGRLVDNYTRQPQLPVIQLSEVEPTAQ